jgi:hypothetical protein
MTRMRASMPLRDCGAAAWLMTLLAGVWSRWLRLWSGSIWPVSPSRSAFKNLMEGVAGVAIATSPAMMAHVTTETGVMTMIIVVLVAGYLLTNRAADFAKAEPKSPRPTTDQLKGRSGRPALGPLPGASLHASPELGGQRCQPKRRDVTLLRLALLSLGLSRNHSHISGDTKPVLMTSRARCSGATGRPSPDR